jgi:hypothetical protein
LLLPVLGRAKSKAFRTQCFNNTRQIGVAQMLYVEDSNDSYPTYSAWGAFGGKQVITNYALLGPNGPSVAQWHGSAVAETNRPLNRYASNKLVFRCPADKGDTLWQVPIPCYEAWGNSYLMSWSMTRYRVEQVGGDSLAAKGTPESKPIKGTRVALRPVSKVILSDWPWFGDRDVNHPRSAWHNDRGKPVFPTLFGDGHTANFLFPKGYQQWSFTPAPDINFLYW